TAEIVARTTIDAIMVSRGAVKTVRIWVWDPANAEVFRRELQRLEAEGWDESKVLTKGTELPIPEETTAQNWLEYGMTGRIRDMTIVVVTGDFTRLEADAIFR